MNRKSFLVLVVVLLVVGGAGLALFWQDISAWRSGGGRIGFKPFEKLPANEVAQINLYDGGNQTTLTLKDGRWVLKERADYPASVQEIGDLLVKLPDWKVVQTESVGASLLPRLNLLAPPAGGKAAEKNDGMGTQLELSDKGGKQLGSVLLGKIVTKKEPSPLPVQQETPVGRYVLTTATPTVLVMSDALKNATAKPDAWLAREFFKADRIKSLASSGDNASWKIARKEEYDPWKFADGGELDPSKAVAAANSLNDLKFVDVATGMKPESLEKPRTFVADTYDNLVYTLKVARKADSDDYYMTVSVTGEPPRARTPEPNEKAEDKDKRDKQFAETLKKLDDRVKAEKALGTWVYVVSGKTLEPLLKTRSDLTAQAAPKKK